MERGVAMNNPSKGEPDNDFERSLLSYIDAVGVYVRSNVLLLIRISCDQKYVIYVEGEFIYQAFQGNSKSNISA